MNKLFFLFGILFLLKSCLTADSPLGSFTPSLYRLYQPAKGQDILTRMFDESVLEQMNNEFIIRLTEAELRGFTILPESRDEIKRALTTQVTRMSQEEVIGALMYAFNENYGKAFEFIINLLPSLDEIIETAKILDTQSDLIKELEMQRDVDNEYVLVTIDESIINPSEFKHLSPVDRLPAAIKKLSGSSLENSEINSEFLSESFIGKFDLKTTLIVFELEMADNLHHHDTKGVIDQYLRGQIFKTSNDVMADLALEMYEMECWASLKFIIDTKFSFRSPFDTPYLFKDLKFLLSKSSDPDFIEKVLKLADASAVRRYLGPVRKTEVSEMLRDFGDFDLDTLEHFETIEFNFNPK